MQVKTLCITIVSCLLLTWTVNLFDYDFSNDTKKSGICIKPSVLYIKNNSNVTSFKCFESKPVVKKILICDRLNLWRHRQFITIFYQFLHIRIEIIHGSHMYILFLPRVGLYVSFLTLASVRGKISWHKGLLVVKQYIHMASMNYFLNKS